MFEYLVSLDFRLSIENDEKAHRLVYMLIQDESPPRPEYQVKCINRI